MKRADVETILEAKPFIIGILGALFALTVKNSMTGYGFDRAEELWREWEKRYLR